VAPAGRKNVIGKPILYKTTKEFLVQFGLKDLSELPSVKEFEELARFATPEPESAPAPAPEPAPGPEAHPEVSETPPEENQSPEFQPPEAQPVEPGTE
jgi:segregation and condensation protein B